MYIFADIIKICEDNYSHNTYILWKRIEYKVP